MDSSAVETGRGGGGSDVRQLPALRPACLLQLHPADCLCNMGGGTGIRPKWGG